MTEPTIRLTEGNIVWTEDELIIYTGNVEISRKLEKQILENQKIVERLKEEMKQLSDRGHYGNHESFCSFCSVFNSLESILNTKESET